MTNRIHIGTASIVLIFIILCLSVFSLLGLSDGKSAEIFAERYADSVTAFYQADMTGQCFIRDVHSALDDSSATLFEAGQTAAALLPADSSFHLDSDGYLVCEIPMNSGQALHIELKNGDDETFVHAYYVYNKEDYAIDNSLPVWNGAEADG